MNNFTFNDHDLAAYLEFSQKSSESLFDILEQCHFLLSENLNSTIKCEIENTILMLRDIILERNILN